MRHLLVGDRSLMVGDHLAGLLLRYAVLLAVTRAADTVEVVTWDDDGEPASLTVLLHAGTSMSSMSVRSAAAEPENLEAERYLQAAITAIERQLYSSHEDIADAFVWESEEAPKP